MRDYDTTNYKFYCDKINKVDWPLTMNTFRNPPASQLLCGTTIGTKRYKPYDTSFNSRKRPMSTGSPEPYNVKRSRLFDHDQSPAPTANGQLHGTASQVTLVQGNTGSKCDRGKIRSNRDDDILQSLVSRMDSKRQESVAVEEQKKNASIGLQSQSQSTYSGLDFFIGIRTGTLGRSTRQDAAKISACHSNTQHSMRRTDSDHFNLIDKFCNFDMRGMPAPTTQVESKQGDIPTVFSTYFLQNRQLVRLIRKQKSEITILERDLSMVMPAQSDKIEGVDVILSPGNGLMITTLQNLKQKALPGSLTQNLTRKRVLRLCESFERLTILIGQGQSGTDSELKTLDEDDTEAFTSFCAFCRCAEIPIAVQLVVGGEHEMSKWILAIIQNNDNEAIGSLQEVKTCEEDFLSRVGLDPLAAQIVLLLIQSRYGQGRTAALRHFVEMNLEDKLDMFTELFGGSRVLRRVDQILRARW